MTFSIWNQNQFLSDNSRLAVQPHTVQRKHSIRSRI